MGTAQLQKQGPFSFTKVILLCRMKTSCSCTMTHFLGTDVTTSWRPNGSSENFSTRTISGSAAGKARSRGPSQPSFSTIHSGEPTSWPYQFISHFEFTLLPWSVFFWIEIINGIFISDTLAFVWPNGPLGTSAWTVSRTPSTLTTRTCNTFDTIFLSKLG